MDSTQIALFSAGTRGALRGFSAVAGPTVQTLAHPDEAVEVTMTIARLKQLFRSVSVASVVVLDHTDADAIGLITRERFMAVMSGRLGYGRAMLARKTVAEITDWQPLVVDPDALVSEVALIAMSRTTERRCDDAIVRAHVWSVVSTSDLVRSLSTVLAVRSLHDALTGLANRGLVRRRLRQHRVAVTDIPERVALVVMDVDDLASVNDRHGVETGDILLAAIARRLTRAAPPVADLAARLRAALSQPEPGLPGGVWRTVSTVVCLSEPGFADPEALIREAFASMRSRKAPARVEILPEPRGSRSSGADSAAH